MSTEHVNDIGLVIITMLSAIGTSIIFQDVKDECKGLLANPLCKPLIVWAFCYTLLRDKQKAFIGTISLIIVYIVVLMLRHKYPEVVAGEQSPPQVQAVQVSPVVVQKQLTLQD